VPTVATNALLVLHVPPGVASVKAVVRPTHTLGVPVMPATADVFTVTTLVAVAVPQPLVTAYDIVTVPTVTPVNRPPETVALPLLALHVPPATASDSVMFDPMFTLDGPDIVPADTAFTVTTNVATAAPQPVVTE
jgi:hypothetical protein